MTRQGEGQTVYHPRPPTVAASIAHSLIAERVVHAMRTPLGVLSSALTEIERVGLHPVVASDSRAAIDRLVRSAKTLSESVFEPESEEEIIVLAGVHIRAQRGRFERGVELATQYLALTGTSSVRSYWDQERTSISLARVDAVPSTENPIPLSAHVRRDHSLEVALLLAAEQHAGALYVQPSILTIPLIRDGARFPNHP